MHTHNNATHWVRKLKIALDAQSCMWVHTHDSAPYLIMTNKDLTYKLGAHSCIATYLAKWMHTYDSAL